MDNNTIDSLKEALKFSPDNIPLRLHLAQTLLGLNRIEEAEKEFQHILTIEHNNEKAKFGLATVFYQKGEYSTCNVILEELIHSDTTDIGLLVLYTRALLKENAISQAIELYQRVLAIIPD
ncbi:MAG: tetratricopeptide repeat protein, partial [Flammeovirgaceae bacterium]